MWQGPSMAAGLTLSTSSVEALPATGPSSLRSRVSCDALTAARARFSICASASAACKIGSNGPQHCVVMQINFAAHAADKHVCIGDHHAQPTNDCALI